MNEETRLDGLTVLLVEDDVFVSMLAEDILIEAGAEVLLAMRLEPALEWATTSPIDFAVLDVNLGKGQTSFPIADVLEKRSIPFVFLSGYDGEGFEGKYSHHPKLQKPYSPEQLAGAVAALYGSRV